ncbi:hypothetical protein CO2235_MP10371 [Cupriavidus oxalaticus]|uniref:Reverse transcriptase domain-containing protein n=1 Tax=Cupriavidus oxalaticus TaxID=96344 RepID=A0A375GI32_9BURK|nr:hypothetical protein CO2235_U1010062 [Cupriavidus oxalaticus]SPC18177.1 hypothetical protein CO2235_MP10371 [Cupriavidus oxalaticus]
MDGGVVLQRYEDTPQGGPLSPLLANVLLDEVDKELERRGHCFVRYADDANVYVRSQRAGERVMALLRRLYGNLRLKVNEAKSAFGRKFRDYSFWVAAGVVKRKVEVKPLLTFKQRIRELTRRSGGRSLQEVVDRLRPYVMGWKAYSRLAQTPKVLRKLDEWMRHRLRAIQLKHWRPFASSMNDLRSLAGRLGEPTSTDTGLATGVMGVKSVFVLYSPAVLCHRLMASVVGRSFQRVAPNKCTETIAVLAYLGREGGWVVHHRLRTRAGDGLAYVGILYGLAQCGHDALLDPYGRALGREEAKPGHRLELRVSCLRSCGHVGERGGTLAALSRQDAQGAGLVVRQRGGDSGEGEVHVVRNHVCDDCARAAVVDCDETGQRHLGRDLLGTHLGKRLAAANGAGLRCLLAVLEQLGQRLHRQLCASDNSRRRLRHGRYGGQLREGVDALEPRCVLREHNCRHLEQQRVAVRLGLHHAARADEAIGAGQVLDHHRLLPQYAELLGHGARRRVRAAAGGVGDDQAHRPVWLPGGGLRQCGIRYEKNRSSRKQGGYCSPI